MGINIGMVGLGQFGVAFADMFMSHPLVDRIALCDREPERIAPFAQKESWQAKLSSRDMYESLDEIIETDLDALVIITQPWLHAEQCVRAMDSGKHVYSAVPIVSLPDGDEILDWCDRLIETCERTGMRYMLGETTYYRPQTMFCRRKAAEGQFGDFVYGRRIRESCGSKQVFQRDLDEFALPPPTRAPSVAERSRTAEHRKE